ncbi:Plant intracellular Ras-group-related LRR protein 5 [Morella rubra]|uniref:Plant intracellular Ras-group-related LRR protein 5 n=1 Tax=Morella rubra TaxID=262757 RepID=A0A6A1VWG7_9ROSI|nr:Plant intracellular Ras-group-related LRR protein 5 [Morella rubra]
MAFIPQQALPSPVFVETVQEIMSIYRSLPPRPSIEEIEAAKSVLETVDTEEQMKLDEISKQKAPQDVPEELFSVLQQVRRTMILFQSHEQSREALHLVELDKMFQTFGDLIQRASALVSGDTQNQQDVGLGYPVEKISRGTIITGESLATKMEDGESEGTALKGLESSSSSKAIVLSSDGGDSGKLSIMKVAALIENSAKTGATVVDLKGKLMDQMEWLPVSIGKLSDVTELDLSENQIMALPPTIGGLRALRKLDIHSNQLINLPDSFGELINLTDLDLRANRLRSLPASFGKLISLINLDLSLNHFTHLPETIGNLTCLKRLNVETNELEELPYTIGSCSSLVELRLDFNQIKALPEAIGKLECLEILTLHYNRVQRLPTTMATLSNLKELDVSFNELEYIPENLCFAVGLKKLIVGKNFADLRTLPRSIGNLEMLEELDISDNQIRVLPDSFRFLSKLRIFCADETPLEVPPRQVTKLGAQAVVQYMADFVAKKDVKSLPSTKKGFWFWVLFDGRERGDTIEIDIKLNAAENTDYWNKSSCLQAFEIDC